MRVRISTAPFDTQVREALPFLFQIKAILKDISYQNELLSKRGL